MVVDWMLSDDQDTEMSQDQRYDSDSEMQTGRSSAAPGAAKSGKDETQPATDLPVKGDMVAIQLAPSDSLRLGKSFALGVCHADMKRNNVDVEVWGPSVKTALFGKYHALLDADYNPVIMRVHKDSLCLIGVDLDENDVMTTASADALREI